MLYCPAGCGGHCHKCRCSIVLHSQWPVPNTWGVSKKKTFLGPTFFGPTFFGPEVCPAKLELAKLVTPTKSPFFYIAIEMQHPHMQFTAAAGRHRAKSRLPIYSSCGTPSCKIPTTHCSCKSLPITA